MFFICHLFWMVLVTFLFCFVFPYTIYYKLSISITWNILQWFILATTLMEHFQCPMLCKSIYFEKTNINCIWTISTRKNNNNFEDDNFKITTVIAHVLWFETGSIKHPISTSCDFVTSCCCSSSFVYTSTK